MLRVKQNVLFAKTPSKAQCLNDWYKVLVNFAFFHLASRANICITQSI